MEPATHQQQQEKVNTYFESQSSYWQDVYTIRGVQAEIIRDRHAAVLDWIDSLVLAPASRVLEIGCGAGFMAIELAQRGFRVHAIDSAEAMIELARQNAAKAGVTASLSLAVDDVYALVQENESFDLIIAIGVIPWLERAELAIQEMARVTKPGGYIIVTTANWAGLASLLDPVVNPAIVPLKRRVKVALERAGLGHRPPGMTFQRNRSFDEALRRAELVKIKGMTHGFGFSFFRLSVFPEPFGTRIHQRLQRLADRSVPVLRSAGMAYFVLARKPTSQPLVPSTSAERPVSDAIKAL